MTLHRRLALPYPVYLWKVVRLSVAMWLLVRLLSVLVLAFAAGPSAALAPPGATRAAIIAVAAFLVWLDRRHAREVLLHANLGASSAWFVLASLVTAIALDGVTQAFLGLGMSASGFDLRR